MAKKTFRTLESGDKLMVGYNDWTAKCLFLGFTNASEKYGMRVKYLSWKMLAKAEGVSTFEELETKQDESGKEYGHHYYALFLDLETEDRNGGTYTFSAYLYNNRWSFGSSASRAILRPIED